MSSFLCSVVCFDTPLFHLKKFLKYQQHNIHLLITTVMNIINLLVALACNVTFYNILDSDIVSKSGGKGDESY